MRALIIWACLGIVACGPKLLTLDQYRERLVERIHAEHPDWKVNGSPPEVDLGHGLTAELLVERGYEQYRNNPSTLEANLDGQILGLEEIKSSPNVEKGLESFQTAEPYLLPGILQGSPSDGSICLPLVGDLYVVYFYDHPDSSQRILLWEKTIEKWHCSVKEIDRAARQNLSRRYPTSPKEVGPSLYRLSDADDYGAARLLNNEALKTLADKHQDDLIVWVPSRMLTWTTPAHNEEGIQKLDQACARWFKDDPEPISPKALRFHRKSGNLTIWNP